MSMSLFGSKSSGLLCLPLAFVLQLSIPLALGKYAALRIHTPDGDAKSLASIVPDTTDICGEPEIWRKLTEDQSVNGVQNIKWSQINQMMDDQITKKTSEISLLTLEIKMLQKQIDEKRLGEAAKSVPADDMIQLIKDGIALFKTDEAPALENAQKSMCGKPALSKSLNLVRRVSRQTLPVFEKAADAYYEGHGKDFPVRMDLGTFLSECGKMLPEGPTPYDSYCPQLCQQFTNYLEKKNEPAGETAGKGSDKLLAEFQEKSQTMATAERDVSLCQSARELIMDFGNQIAGQKEEIDKRFEKYREAEERLADAAHRLVEKEGELENEQELLKAAAEVLEKSTADTSALEAAVSKLMADEAELQKELGAVQSTLEATNKKLWAAKEADTVVLDLRTNVASISSTMRTYFDKVVLQPLSVIGLGEAMNTTEYVLPDISKLSSGKKLLSVLTELEEFCQGDAAKSFKAVEKHVDLSPMCKFKPAADVFVELDMSVNSTRETIREGAAQLQTWFDPLKGQSEMTMEKVKHFVELGEPSNLRLLAGVFHRATIWKKYLKEWQRKKKFFKLMGKLKEVVTDLDKSFQELSAQVEKLSLQLTEMAEQRAKAQKALAEAIDKKELDENSVEKLEQTVDKLQGTFESLTDHNRLLQAEVEEAKAEWEQSKQDLLKMYEDATSLVEVWSDEEEHSLAVEAAKEKLAMAKVALGNAESSLEAVKESLQMLAD